MKTDTQRRNDTDADPGLVRILLADESGEEAVEEMQPEKTGEQVDVGIGIHQEGAGNDMQKGGGNEDASRETHEVGRG